MINYNPFIENHGSRYMPTEREIIKATCTHRKINGLSALILNTDGSVTCDVCGETFTLVEPEDKELDDLIAKMRDVLQTTKTIHITKAPDDFLEFVSDMIASLPYIVTVYKQARKDFNNQESIVYNTQSSESAFETLIKKFQYYQPNSQAPVYAGNGYMSQPFQAHSNSPSYPYYNQPNCNEYIKDLKQMIHDRMTIDDIGD